MERIIQTLQEDFRSQYQRTEGSTIKELKGARLGIINFLKQTISQKLL